MGFPLKMAPNTIVNYSVLPSFSFLISGANDINLFCSAVPAYGLLSFPGVQQSTFPVSSEASHCRACPVPSGN